MPNEHQSEADNRISKKVNRREFDIDSIKRIESSEIVIIKTTRYYYISLRTLWN